MCAEGKLKCTFGPELQFWGSELPPQNPSFPDLQKNNFHVELFTLINKYCNCHRPSVLSKGYRGSYPWVKSRRFVKLTTHLQLLPRLKNAWSYTTTPPARLHGAVL